MAANAKVLIIEDEKPIAESVAYSLGRDGFEVATAEDGLEGLSLFRQFGPDIIILDLMLPKLGGLDFCRIVRKESQVPIVMLTAKSEEVDKIVGLELGADDYITKPFSMRELSARIKSILRRFSQLDAADAASMLTVGSIAMDVARRRVMVNGEQVHLPLKQFELLRVLLQNNDRVVSRDELLKAVWDSESNFDTGSLDVHIRWLREKIEADPSRPLYIRTIRGIGYRVVGLNDDEPA